MLEPTLGARVGIRDDQEMICFMISPLRVSLKQTTVMSFRSSTTDANSAQGELRREDIFRLHLRFEVGSVSRNIAEAELLAQNRACPSV